MTARRVLLFDSTLTHGLLVADSTAATSNAYGRQAGALIRYRGDTALFISPASLSMLVIGPAGTIVRIMAILFALILWIFMTLPVYRRRVTT